MNSNDLKEEDKPPGEISLTISSGRMPSFSENALIEYGQASISESTRLAAEFHKTMLGISATFTSLMCGGLTLLLLGTKTAELSGNQKAGLAVSVTLMLGSSVCFALGFYPKLIYIQANSLMSLRRSRDKILKSRRTSALTGMVMFCMSIFSFLCVIAFLG